MKSIDILSMGELLIDFTASEQGLEAKDAAMFIKNPGGAPANVAVGAARLGRSAAFIGKVGDDPFGHYLSEVLGSEGVDCTGLLFDGAFKTTLTFVSIGSGGERSFTFYRNPGADMMIRPGELDLDLIQNSRIFEHGSISLIAEPSASATKVAIEAADQSGSLICFDPNLRPALWPDMDIARHVILDATLRSDVVKVGVDELLEITESGNEAEGISKLRRHAKKGAAVIVTLGEKGSRAYCGDVEAYEPGFVVDAIDTTGAGDGFFACLLSGVLSMAGKVTLRQLLPAITEDGWRHLLRRANAAGAICTTKKGAIPSLPTLAELDDFLSHRWSITSTQET